jgi:hypothetical protein
MLTAATPATAMARAATEPITVAATRGLFSFMCVLFLLEIGDAHDPLRRAADLGSGQPCHS